MNQFSFKSYTDSGEPKFIQTDTQYSIVCVPGDRGRWLGDYLEQLHYGQPLRLLIQARASAPDDSAASILLTWWKNVPGMTLHSTEHVAEISGIQEEYKQFIYDFSVPYDVKLLRIDLRAWGGPGAFEFKDIRIIPNEDPPAPPNDTMLTITLDLVTVKWRITATQDSITTLRIEPEVTS